MSATSSSVRSARSSPVARRSAGSLVHVCVRLPEGGLRYIDIWESEEACARAFDERIHPAVDRAFGGARPPGEPEVHRLDVIDLRGAAVPDGVR